MVGVTRHQRDDRADRRKTLDDLRPAGPLDVVVGPSALTVVALAPHVVARIVGPALAVDVVESRAAGQLLDGGSSTTLDVGLTTGRVNGVFHG